MCCPQPLCLPGKGIYSHMQELSRAVRFDLMQPVQGWWISLHCPTLHPAAESWQVSLVVGTHKHFRSQHWDNSVLPCSISHRLSCRLPLWGSNDTSPQPGTARSGEETHFTALQKPEGFVAWTDQFSCMHSFYAIPSFMLGSVCHTQWITQRKSN